MTEKPPTPTSSLVTEVALTAIVLAGAVIGATLLVRAVAHGYSAVVNAFGSR